MGPLNANAEKAIADELAERLREARKSIKSLQHWLGVMDKEIERHKEGACSAYWCSRMMEKALEIYDEISQYNGAILVLGRLGSKELLKKRGI